ncbi:MAG: TonB-dependent receptor [Acidobacteriota bacterium]|nr:TonB-dependent receptor [Acidobacteriota bacterium]
MKRYLLMCLLAVVSVPWAAAQSQATTGVIEGTVTDESGNPLPGVVVTLINTATNFQKELVTDAQGRYRGLLLPLGPYRVRATMTGFATGIRDGLRLTVGRTLVVDFAMKPASVAEEIVVKAANPIVETSRTQNLTQIDEASVQGLPNNGRNFLDFMTLSPGVTIVQGPDGEEISVNGQKGINNNISMDGTDFNNPFFGEQRGGQRAAFTFNLDAVEEVVVVSEGAPAEFGRASSGFVNVITKSGTNELTGSSHLFHKNDSLNGNAENPDGSEADDFDFDATQIGVTFGGPLIKDKAFYFVTFDNQGLESTRQTDPTRIEQRVVDYYASIGFPNENGPITRTDDAWSLSLKTDWFLSANDQVTVRFTATDSEQENGTFDVDSWGRSANAVELDDSWSINAAWNHTFPNGMYNEFRVQWARENRPRDYTNPNIPGQDRPLPDTAFDFNKQYRFGMPFFIPVEYYDTRFQINENISWVRGNHFFKAGVEFNLTRAFQTFIGFANSRFIFSSTDGFLNYVANPNYVECQDADENFLGSQTGECPDGYDAVGPVLLYLQYAGVGGITPEEAGTQLQRTKEFAVFLQDTWQPLENLTIQYGLRLETQDHPEVQTPPNEVFFSDFIGTTSMGNPFPSDGTIPDEDSMWQPRLAMTWDPANDGRSVIRATAGIYYARIPGLTLASVRSTNGSIGQNLYRDSTLIPILGPPPAYLQQLDATGAEPFRPDVFVTSTGFRNPRTDTYSISYERAINETFAASLKFVYSDGRYQTRFINRNDPLLGEIIDPDGDPDDPNNYNAPWSTGLGGGFNGIGALTSIESTGDSLYRGWTISLNKARSNNFQFQLNYTWSEDFSHDDNERDPFTYRYADIRNLDGEWGYSDRDQRHRFNGWVLWEAPYGIQVNGRYTYRSGQPKSLKPDGTDAVEPGQRALGGGEVFERNTGRKNNELRSLDIRVSKVFQFNGWELEPIIEGFNLTNSRNLLNPAVTSLVFNFDGTVQSGAGIPRQIQIGVKGRW